MPTIAYITIGLVLMLVAICIVVALWIRHFTGIVERKFTAVNLCIQEQEERICTLEAEKQADHIKYNALEGAYRRVIEKLDALLIWAKEAYARMKEANIEPPQPPDGLDLDLRANGKPDRANGWREYL